MAYDNRYSNNNPRMGGQQRGGRPRADEITTNGVILHNERFGRFLRTRFWNGTLGLDIGSYPPGSPPTFETVRNAQIFGHVFSFSTIFELREICEEVLTSISATNTFESTATEAGMKKDCIVEISNGSNINMSPGIYLVIYKNVDSNKRSNTYEIYPFSGTRVLRGYDHGTGHANEDIKATGNFKKFLKILDEAANAFTMAQAHAAAEVKKGEKMATITALSAISAALGVDISKSVANSTRVSNSDYTHAQQANNYQRKMSSPSPQWGQSGGYQQPAPARGQYQPDTAITDEQVDINLNAASLQNVDLNSLSNG